MKVTVDKCTNQGTLEGEELWAGAMYSSLALPSGEADFDIRSLGPMCR